MTINLFSWFELVEYNHRQEFRIDMRNERCSLRTADVSPRSSPLRDVSRGGTFATQRQKFHTDDVNQWLSLCSFLSISTTCFFGPSFPWATQVSFGSISTRCPRGSWDTCHVCPHPGLSTIITRWTRLNRLQKNKNRKFNCKMLVALDNFFL